MVETVAAQRVQLRCRVEGLLEGQEDSEAPSTALGHTWMTSEAGNSRGNKRGQPPRYFGRNYTAYAKPICLKEFLRVACSSRKKPDAFPCLYKCNHGIS